MIASTSLFHSLPSFYSILKKKKRTGLSPPVFPLAPLTDGGFVKRGFEDVGLWRPNLSAGFRDVLWFPVGWNSWGGVLTFVCFFSAYFIFKVSFLLSAIWQAGVRWSTGRSSSTSLSVWHWLTSILVFMVNATRCLFQEDAKCSMFALVLHFDIDIDIGSSWTDPCSSIYEFPARISLSGDSSVAVM